MVVGSFVELTSGPPPPPRHPGYPSVTPSSPMIHGTVSRDNISSSLDNIMPRFREDQTIDLFPFGLALSPASTDLVRFPLLNVLVLRPRDIQLLLKDLFPIASEFHHLLCRQDVAFSFGWL